MGSLASVSILFSTIISVAISTTDVSLPVPKSLSMMSSDSSQKVLSRKRRFFIPQTSGWLLKGIFDTIIPVEGGNGGPILIRLPITYNIDSGSITGRSFETGAARTFSSHEDHRHSILRTVESYLERMGGFHDGHACILRAICEVAETPQNTDGFLGDLVNMMLAPVYLLDGYNGNIGEDTDYILAQKDGYFGRDCSRYHHDCPASLFSYVDGNDYGDYAYGGSSYANYTHDYPYPDHSENEIF